MPHYKFLVPHSKRDSQSTGFTFCLVSCGCVYSAVIWTGSSVSQQPTTPPETHDQHALNREAVLIFTELSHFDMRFWQNNSNYHQWKCFLFSAVNLFLVTILEVTICPLLQSKQEVQPVLQQALGHMLSIRNAKKQTNPRTQHTGGV